jgi:hypothetical protein
MGFSTTHTLLAHLYDDDVTLLEEMVAFCTAPPLSIILLNVGILEPLWS